MSLTTLIKSFRKLNTIGDNILITNMIIKNIEQNKLHKNCDIIEKREAQLKIPISTLKIPISTELQDIIQTIPANELHKHMDFLHHSQYQYIQRFEKNMDKTVIYWNDNKLCLNEFWTGY